MRYGAPARVRHTRHVFRVYEPSLYYPPRAVMMLLGGALFLATPALLGRRDRILRSRNNFFKNKEAYTRLRGVARMLEMQDTPRTP